MRMHVVLLAIAAGGSSRVEVGVAAADGGVTARPVAVVIAVVDVELNELLSSL